MAGSSWGGHGGFQPPSHHRLGPCLLLLLFFALARAGGRGGPLREAPGKGLFRVGVRPSEAVWS